MTTSKIERNRQAMERFVQFINTSDKTIGEQIISPDVIFFAPTSPEPMHGLDSYMGVLAMMRGAMPDVQWTVEEVIAEDNKVVVRFTMRGTQTNPFMGMPATGKSICVTAMNIYEFNDEGLIVHEHGLPDLFSLLGQLGMIPQP